MKTKIVTGYWMGIHDEPWYGASPSRTERYLGSLISHCRGFNVPVICYTHEKSFAEVEKIKQDYSLDNLEIKLLELTETKYHKQVQQLRDTFNVIERFPDLHGRTPEVMWTKFEVLEKESTDTDFIYWIDVGLQHPGIFPWEYNPEPKNPELHRHPYKQWNFTPILNQKTLESCNALTENKIFILGTKERWYGVPEIDRSGLEESFVEKRFYPIAGFFGGSSKIVQEYCSMFFKVVEQYLRQETLPVEQPIMKIVGDYFPEEKTCCMDFDDHQVPYINDYEYKPYTGEGKKPLYVIFKELQK